MLSFLTVNNILLIDCAEIEFKPGLNIITGETGAGKSVLLDCLSFVLGWNNRSDLLRNGQESGEVIAEFLIESNEELRRVLDLVDIKVFESLIIRRTLSEGGRRRRIYINDKVVSLGLLKSLTGHLVEMQGQKDSQALLNERSHRKFLDQFAGLEQLLVENRNRWSALKSAEKEVTENALVHEKSIEEIDYMRQAISEIEEIGALKKIVETQKKDLYT